MHLTSIYICCTLHSMHEDGRKARNEEDWQSVRQSQQAIGQSRSHKGQGHGRLATKNVTKTSKERPSGELHHSEGCLKVAEDYGVSPKLFCQVLKSSAKFIINNNMLSPVSHLLQCYTCALTVSYLMV